MHSETTEKAPEANRYWPAGPLVDRDQVGDAVISYVRAHAHALGARSWADLVGRQHPDHGPAHRRALESAEVAGGYLAALGMTLFAEPEDGAAFVAFVEDVHAALVEGHAAGFDGEPSEPAFLDDDECHACDPVDGPCLAHRPIETVDLPGPQL